MTVLAFQFMYLTVPIPVNRLKSREIIVQPWDPKEQRIKVSREKSGSKRRPVLIEAMLL